MNETTSTARFTTEQAGTYAITTFEDQDALEASIAEMPATTVPLLLARVTALRKWLQQIEKMCESRITAEKIIPFGNDWPDPDTGVLYTYKGDLAERKIADPHGLRAALIEVGVPESLVARAIHAEPKVEFRVLAEISKTKREWAEIIEDFEGERKFRPPHLVEKE